MGAGTFHPVYWTGVIAGSSHLSGKQLKNHVT